MEKLPFELSGEMPSQKPFPAYVPTHAEKNLKEIVALLESLHQKKVDRFIHLVHLKIEILALKCERVSVAKTVDDLVRQGEMVGYLEALLFAKQLFTKIFIKND